MALHTRPRYSPDTCSVILAVPKPVLLCVFRHGTDILGGFFCFWRRYNLSKMTLCQSQGWFSKSRANAFFLLLQLGIHVILQQLPDYFMIWNCGRVGVLQFGQYTASNLHLVWPNLWDVKLVSCSNFEYVHFILLT